MCKKKYVKGDAARQKWMMNIMMNVMTKISGKFPIILIEVGILSNSTEILCKSFKFWEYQPSCLHQLWLGHGDVVFFCLLVSSCLLYKLWDQQQLLTNTLKWHGQISFICTVSQVSGNPEFLQWAGSLYTSLVLNLFAQVLLWAII